ncbi:MAG: hypothetical protein M4579_003563 [Chaenotheca gracillima]|nr:MAG: hypothetical protein M4579_003563 [Chaenotheca gracillima]
MAADLPGWTQDGVESGGDDFIATRSHQAVRYQCPAYLLVGQRETESRTGVLMSRDGSNYINADAAPSDRPFTNLISRVENQSWTDPSF